MTPEIVAVIVLVAVVAVGAYSLNRRKVNDNSQRSPIAGSTRDRNRTDKK